MSYKSYIFNETAIFVNNFKHFQGIGFVSQLYVRGMASLHFQNLVFEINRPIGAILKNNKNYIFIKTFVS